MSERRYTEQAILEVQATSLEPVAGAFSPVYRRQIGSNILVNNFARLLSNSSEEEQRAIWARLFIRLDCCDADVPAIRSNLERVLSSIFSGMGER